MTAYIDRCDQAAQDQGVAQISQALSELGIKNTIEQTGGFIMCVFVWDKNEDSYLCVTDGVVSYYPSYKDPELWDSFELLECLDEDCTTSDTVAAVLKHMNRIGK